MNNSQNLTGAEKVNQITVALRHSAPIQSIQYKHDYNNIILQVHT